MVTLLILSHAKTLPDAPAGDHARELTERGHRNAAAMGAHIHNPDRNPGRNHHLGRDASRQTAEIVAPAVDFAAPLTVEPRLYAADLDTLLSVVRRIPAEVQTAIIVGHNPGLRATGRGAGRATLNKECDCRPRDSPSSSSTSSAGTRYEWGQVACARWPHRARSPDRPLSPPASTRVRTL